MEPALNLSQVFVSDKAEGLLFYKLVPHLQIKTDTFLKEADGFFFEGLLSLIMLLFFSSSFAFPGFDLQSYQLKKVMSSVTDFLAIISYNFL